MILFLAAHNHFRPAPARLTSASEKPFWRILSAAILARARLGKYTWNSKMCGLVVSEPCLRSTRKTSFWKAVLIRGIEWQRCVSLGQTTDVRSSDLQQLCYIRFTQALQQLVGTVAESEIHFLTIDGEKTVEIDLGGIVNHQAAALLAAQDGRAKQHATKLRRGCERHRRVIVWDGVPAKQPRRILMREPRQLFNPAKRPPMPLILPALLVHRPIWWQRNDQLGEAILLRAVRDSHSSVAHAGGDNGMKWAFGGRLDHMQVDVRVFRHNLMKHRVALSPASFDVLRNRLHVARDLLGQPRIG